MTNEERKNKREEEFSSRERAAGLTLAGNDTTSGRNGKDGPTFKEREAAAGLTLADNNTTSGRGVKDEKSRSNIDNKNNEENKTSVARQQANRNKREVIEKQKNEMKQALFSATGSTRATREVKRSFKPMGYMTSSVEIGSRQQPVNLQDSLSSISRTGIDKINRDDTADFSGY